jgi:hypothetical protein
MNAPAVVGATKPAQGLPSLEATSMTQHHHTTILPDFDAEDLACLGLRRADNFWNQFRDLLEPDPCDDPAVLAALDRVLAPAFIETRRAFEQAGLIAPMRDDAGRERANRPHAEARKPFLPNGLRTPAEAAERLHCSIKSVLAHVAAGELRYVAIGQGRKRPRKMFTDSDLDQFIENRTRKDAGLCPSSKTHVRRSTDTASKSCVIAFTARRNARPGAKPKQ